MDITFIYAPHNQCASMSLLIEKSLKGTQNPHKSSMIFRLSCLFFAQAKRGGLRRQALNHGILESVSKGNDYFSRDEKCHSWVVAPHFTKSSLGR